MAIVQAPSRKRSLLVRHPVRLIFLLLASALIAFCIYEWVEIHRQEARLDIIVAELDVKDPGWRIAEIEAARMAYPSETKNSALQVLGLKALLPSRPWPKWPFPELEGQPERLKTAQETMEKRLWLDHAGPALLDSNEERAFRAELAVAAKALEKARRLAELPEGRYPLAWRADMNVLLPHADSANLARYMLYVDGLLHAQDKDEAGAILDVRALLNVGRVTGDEPFLVSQGCRLATGRAALQLLERVLAFGQTDDAVLVRLQNEIARETETPSFRTAMRGERAVVDGFLVNAQKSEIGFRELTRHLFILRASQRRAGQPASYSQGLDDYWQTILFYGQLRSLRAAMLERLTRLAEIAELPTPQQWKALDEFEANPMPGNLQTLDFMTTSKQNYTRNLLALDLAHKARFRAAQVALAAERFRLSKGRWPASIEQMIPAYLAAVPEDPYNGKPLHFSRTPSGLVIYAIGKDSIDDGGTLTNPEDKSDEPDVGFLLYDPNKRRQPAKPFPFPPEVPQSKP